MGLRGKSLQLQSDNESLSESHRALERVWPSRVCPRRKCGSAAAAPEGPPAADLQYTNAYARLKDKSAQIDARAGRGLPQGEPDQRRQSFGRVFAPTGDPALLAERCKNIPTMRKVDFEAAFKKDASRKRNGSGWTRSSSRLAGKRAGELSFGAGLLQTGQTDQAVYEDRRCVEQTAVSRLLHWIAYRMTKKPTSRRLFGGGSQSNSSMPITFYL